MDENLKEVSEEFILDSFVMDDGVEIVVLSPELFNGKIDKDVLMLCKIEEENGENVLRSLTEEEYDSAAKQYFEMLELFGGEE